MTSTSRWSTVEMNMCRHVPLYLPHHACDLRPRSGLGPGPRWRASKEYGVNEVMAEVLLPSAATIRCQPGSLGDEHHCQLRRSHTSSPSSSCSLVHDPSLFSRNPLPVSSCRPCRVRSTAFISVDHSLFCFSSPSFLPRLERLLLSGRPPP